MLTILMKKNQTKTHLPLQNACLRRKAPATCICWGKKSRPAMGSFPWKKTQLSTWSSRHLNKCSGKQSFPLPVLITLKYYWKCYILAASMSQPARMNTTLMNLSLCASVCSVKQSICVWNLIRDGSNWAASGLNTARNQSRPSRV